MAADLGGAKAGGGSTAKNAYLQCLRSTLSAAVCLANFGCQEIERNNKPEVEMGALLAAFGCIIVLLVRARRACCCLILCRPPPLHAPPGRSREVLMNPVVISRNESECVLVEGSINSVRISVKVKKADDLEEFLAKKFMRCAPPLALGLRCRPRALQVSFAACGELCCAEKEACSSEHVFARTCNRAVSRVTAVQDYDISFLITNFHTEAMWAPPPLASIPLLYSK